MIQTFVKESSVSEKLEILVANVQVLMVHVVVVVFQGLFPVLADVNRLILGLLGGVVVLVDGRVGPLLGKIRSARPRPTTTDWPWDLA